MAGSRILRFFVPTLLGLLFLAWLPASEAALPDDPYLFQIEDVLSLSDSASQGEADWSGRLNGEDGPDASCRAVGDRVSNRFGRCLLENLSDADTFAALAGDRHATGPPGALS